MAKKKFIWIIYLVLILVVMASAFAAYFYLFNKGSVDKITSTSKDGAVSMTAQFYDFSGNQVVGTRQALIGGISRRTHVVFTLAVSNTGNVQLTNVKPVNPNANMADAFNNTSPLATLNIGASGIALGTSGQSCTTDAQCNSNEGCVGNASKFCAVKLDSFASGTSQHNVDFTISITGDYKKANGTIQSVTSAPVTLTYDIRAETCSDGTTINTCVYNRTGIAADKPKYCNFAEGSAASVIDKASICGCPPGKEVSGETCIVSTCADGTTVNTCSTVSHEGSYGAYYYCKGDKTYEPRCYMCGATVDANGNAKTACSGAGDPSSAIYANYVGGLSGTLSE